MVGVDILGLGFLISRFCNFSNCIGVNIIQDPRLGIGRTNIHPSSSPEISHCHSN